MDHAWSIYRIHNLQEKVSKLIFRDLDILTSSTNKTYFSIVVIIAIIKDIFPHHFVDLNSSHNLFQFYFSDKTISIL